MTLTYALITPARDEADNLRRLAECVASQTVAPQRWVIVDNDSTDETHVVAAELARRYDWVRAISTSASRAPEPGAPIVRSFHAGLRHLDEPADIIVKLDADVSMRPPYFESLLRAFREDPALGIASGECFEQDDGEWTLRPVTHGHARGATRAYRWECLQAVVPLPERVGWDTVDEVKANVGGWRTGTIPGLRFHHHRRVGERDGAPWARWVQQGSAAHYLGYRFWYLVLRTLHRTLQQPAAIGMLVGYSAAAVKREKHCDDPMIRAHLRRRQSLRRLPLRVREALGRGRGSIGV